MLEMVKLDETRLKEAERLLGQITNELEEGINIGESLNLRPLYEQQELMMKVRSVLEDLRELMVKLEGFKKKLSFE